MELSKKPPKPHAVCIPFPSQGHINPMLKFSILLHTKGFHITFVNSEYNHKRLRKSRGPSFLENINFQDFIFETIPDGLPPIDADTTQHIPSLCFSTKENCLTPFRDLLIKINNNSFDVPPVTCIIFDGIMTFALLAAQEIGVPSVSFRTTNACSFMCNKHLPLLVQKGILPLKDESDITNGYLDTIIDCIPSMENIRLREFPSQIRTTDINDKLLNFIMGETERSSKASAIIFHTFDSLEFNVLRKLSLICPSLYTIGPLQLLTYQLPQEYSLIEANLWKEDEDCVHWLNSKEEKSVVYVNFGSITVLTKDQLMEFAWGLANSKKNFLWVIRSDAVVGDDSIMLPNEFVEETKERCMISRWCCQEQVLKHSSIGAFLTHCGWNSVMESIGSGVPMICWPFFADQHINCRYACYEWGVGMEIGNNVKRDEVENIVREMMDGAKGKKVNKKVSEWKKLAEEATGLEGSSTLNLDKLVNDILLSNYSVS